MRLDLNKLDHLIAVAEEGSLTRAAVRLHLSQQALSTSIRALEREVGVPLLERSSAGVTALPAGAALLEDARVLHGMARAALHRARHIGRDETQALRIGYTPAVTGDELVTLLAPVTEAHPDITPEIHQRYPSELTDALLAGDLDIGLCRAMTPAHGLTRTTLGHHRLHIAVACDHPLAARTSVSLPELAHETFLIWGTPGRSGYTDLLIDHCRNAGFEPNTERTTRQGTPPITAVIGTRHLAFVTTPPGPAAGGKAQILILEPPIHAPLHALYLPHTTCPSRTTLLTHVRL
ncbi:MULTISPECIES: LysR substrate-binding domain-containing protein [Streptomyces]|uniref:LysR substrate-binding domain-containing protein n=1 Tax=Streptomyces TaxID=1883 RepID=UPI001CC8FEF9|nr:MULTISPECIES: LysR substrate-binding domain-containing protein [Streptomyces]MBZ6139819.1 LysR family transcriptional regulator [Streptomyces olivaceus]MBZ6166276.1 LysR family transcriptional regulator [Streptomyces olivaceus]MBZ6172017.1 LysR family transcriptional regulator [Streptomyces olivaceus]MBZ6183213.1 LysR family transcriptional regulator [Streptomyces olivaceus]WFB84959.1 LysR substrate-binding domain-containing protein [Streptomyces olivaceus]